MTIRKRDFVLPAILLTAPLLLSLGLLPLPVLGDVHFPLYVPGVFENGITLALAVVTAIQVVMTVIRLEARNEALVHRRVLLGRALVVIGVVSWVAAYTLLVLTGRESVFMGGRRAIFELYVGPQFVGTEAIAVVLAGLAFECSRRGPLSGVVLLVSGEWIAKTPWPFIGQHDNRAAASLASIASALVIVLSVVALLAALVFAIARARLGREGLATSARKSFRERDLGYAPLVLALAIKLVSMLTFHVDRSLRGVRLGFPGDARWYAFVLLIALSVARARRQDDPETLRRAGLTALFREHEVALLPWAFAELAWRLATLRLQAAAAGDDPLLSANSASAAAAYAPSVAFFVTGFLVLLGLPSYLRYAGIVTPDSPTPAGSGAS